MFSGLATKMALRKAGIKSDTFDFSGGDSAKGGAKPQSAFDEDEASSNGGWPAWMSARKLPLTAQAWLSPAPPPVPVAECPKVGDLAPLDRDRQLNFGGGQPVVILFMRCVGCACKQYTVLSSSPLRPAPAQIPRDICMAGRPSLAGLRLQAGPRITAGPAPACHAVAFIPPSQSID